MSKSILHYADRLWNYVIDPRSIPHSYCCIVWGAMWFLLLPSKVSVLS